ncbi:hypothetical protein J7E50_17920 [Pedobacter sp. ISL-68]|uniref:hypothetical protein n=1 Tax=unclassified Pedobacter TaxID=2628915 RepID=UPI001BE9BE4B|nr:MULTISPECIES: hypothetical protein [unclassified Pedobacter]MBT2559802.1 hypothetical protein [Pedobacter sp. ISL-64]MBT2592107.1 hypothetical protein [Pedobacter sp. ISL-68]
MVKKIFFGAGLLLHLSACCYTGVKTSYGLPRKAIRKLDVAGNYSSLIDTSAVYKIKTNFFYNKSLKKYTYYEKDSDTDYAYTSYFKFYGGGKLGLFIISKSDTAHLKREDFNPLKAKMGYFTIKENGEIQTRISTIGNCNLFISNEKGFVKGDSIVLERHFGVIYEKKRLPKGILENWTPDW